MVNTATTMLILIGTIKPLEKKEKIVKQILDRNFIDYEEVDSEYDILSYTTNLKDQNTRSYLKNIEKELKPYSKGVISIFKKGNGVCWGSLEEAD